LGKYSPAALRAIAKAQSLAWSEKRRERWSRIMKTANELDREQKETLQKVEEAVTDDRKR